MKKKFRLWLNIVTICLCVCAIAIGVYAATSATLTVSGQIGFTAHGVDVSVKGYIYGHAAGNTVEQMKNGLPVVYDENNKVWLTYDNNVSTGTTPLQVTNSGKTLNIGDRYFSDMNNDPSGKPNDIVIVLEFTNASKFNVVAKIDSVSAVNTNINIETTQSVVMNKETGTGSISFTLSLKPNAQGEYEGADLSAVSFGIKFEKTELTSSQAKQDKTYVIKAFTPTEINTLRTTIESLFNYSMPPYDIEGEGRDKTYMERFPYYVEMGTDPTSKTALRWLVIGIDDGNGNLTNLAQADYDALSQGLMLDKDYYLLSEKLLDKNVFLSSSAYDNSGKNKEYGTWANDYTTSEIRKYLNNTVKDKYNLTSSTIYSQIQTRTLGELYVDIVAESANGTNKITGVPTSIEGKSPITDTASTEEKLWLLSALEARVLFSSDESSECPDYYLSSITPVQGIEFVDSDQLEHWWLRSSNEGSKSAMIFNSSGGLQDYEVGNDNPGIRPAFKI